MYRVPAFISNSSTLDRENWRIVRSRFRRAMERTPLVSVYGMMSNPAWIKARAGVGGEHRASMNTVCRGRPR